MSEAGAQLPPEGGGEDYALAHRHRPLLRLDEREPYLPLAYGYTIFREAGQSPSSKFQVIPQGALCIEYAIWYDWDIEHLYDLEHIWVHLDEAGEVIAVEASVHGRTAPMDFIGGLPHMEGARPVLYSEPGKHAHWPSPDTMAAEAGEWVRRICAISAGREAVHRGNFFFERGDYTISPLADRLARRKMQRDAFVPRFAFSRSSDDAPVVLTPWAALEAWIPARMTYLMAQLPGQVPHLKALFFDCGDTLIDESTEVKIGDTEIVVSGEEIPHAMGAVRTLHAEGYPLVLVADGPRESFENLLKPRGIWELMQGHVISGDVGELKPSPKMFAAAMEVLGLEDEARARVVMVGNNLSRDIKGANEFGLLSLFVAWSNRRSHISADPSEVPTARIGRLNHLVPTIEAMELALPAMEAPHG